MIGAVLCGGRSRRMGSPKALLPWDGADLLTHAVHRLRAAGLAPVCLGPKEWARARGVRQFPDAVQDAGPLGGVLAAVREDDVFLLAVDMPLFTAQDIAVLSAAGRSAGVLTLPAQDGMLTALCGYWPHALAAPLHDYVAGGGRRVIGFAESVEHRFLDDAALWGLGIARGHLAGLNTPEEYAAAVAAAHGQEGAP